VEAALARQRREGGGNAGIEILLRQIQIDHDQHWRSPVGQSAVLPNEEFFMMRVSETLVSRPDGRKGRNLRREEELSRVNQPLQEGPLPGGYSQQDFYTLCRGETLQRNNSISSRREKHCQLKTKGHPYFMLAPLREEILSASPLLVLYHDLLTEGEMRFMKEKVSSQMNPATVQDLTNNAGKVSLERSQASGWLWDNDYPQLYQLARRTAAMTGLEVARPPHLLGKEGGEWIEAEAWQMGLYGPGGHYLPHYDAFDTLDHLAYTSTLPNKVWRGNRVATVMYYLSELVGGATAFPLLGIAATPQPGTAVFWYNMEADGERIAESLHGACPTALGIKWVSNKWIREGSQLWNRPCPKKI